MQALKPHLAVFLALALLATGKSWANPPLRCLIEPEQVAEVGSPVIGVVEATLVERGARVRQGQVLARLRADVERASVGVAAARAQADADLRAALANHQFMRQKLERAEDLVAKKFISQQALEQARAEADMAAQRLAQSREQKRIWQREHDLAQAQLGLREIRAPFDGVVADRYVSVGERVEHKPTFRVAKVDPLRVEIVVPASLFGTVRAGAVARVMPDLPSVGVLEARVVLVDELIDAASNTFRVRAELPNPEGSVPSGLRCKAELSTPGPSRPEGENPAQNQREGLKLQRDLLALPGREGASPPAPPVR